MVSEPHYGPPPDHVEVSGGSDNAWPCAVMMLIACLMFLGACFAGVYLLINWPQS